MECNVLKKFWVASISPLNMNGEPSLADYGIYEKLEFLYEEYNAMTVADSAFIGKRPYLILSGDEHGTRTAQELLLKPDATSIRQMAEWGMCRSQPNS
jgi:hypothetical protein